MRPVAKSWYLSLRSKVYEFLLMVVAEPWIATVVVTAVLTGVILRWWVLSGPLGYMDLDEATVGLQTAQFLESPEVFFRNQPYGGTVETAVVAILFKLFGTSVLTLKLVPIMLHAISALLMWRAARRLISNTTGQLAVPIVLWCAPAYGVWWSTKERGFYGASILAAAATLL